VLARHVNDVTAAAWGVRGVRGVTNALEVHDRAEDVPALQGAAPRPEPRAEFLQENWSPTARLLASAGGGAMAWSGLATGGPMGWALACLGGALVARGATNTRMKRLLGIRSGRRAVDLHKTINVQAPVAEVYAFWRHFENFPRFMAHVKEVRDLGDGRSHWTVCGPAGIEFRWDAEITREEANRVLAWKTMPGAIVQHAGIVHFVPNVQRGTQVDVHLSYNPPAGATGHAIAYLLGTDPKTMMDEDLVRLKSLIENGKASAPGKTARRDEVIAA
jgi:uncharacterized membrane protein